MTVQIPDMSALKDLFEIYCSPNEILGLKELKPSVVARNHNSEAGKNVAY